MAHDMIGNGEAVFIRQPLLQPMHILRARMAAAGDRQTTRDRQVVLKLPGEDTLPIG